MLAQISTGKGNIQEASNNQTPNRCRWTLANAKCHANELDQPLGISEGFTARSEQNKYGVTCKASRVLLHVVTLSAAGALE